MSCEVDRKPGFVCAGHRTIIYLGRTLPYGSSSLPESQTRRTAAPFCLALLQMGFTWLPESPRIPVSSYPTVSPLPRNRGEPRSVRRSVFCGTFPDLTTGWRYQPFCPLEPGLSSRDKSPAIIRSTSSLIVDGCRQNCTSSVRLNASPLREFANFFSVRHRIEVVDGRLWLSNHGVSNCEL